MTESSPSDPDLSIVIPVYNEAECIEDVMMELRETLDAAGIQAWEALLVDDGSTDRSAEIIRAHEKGDPRFHLIRFERNCGQTAALDAGFRAARGCLVGMMDGDGQNDPADFPRLIELLETRGVDMMCGIRTSRHDSFVRRLSSRVANGTRNWATGENVTDVGCSIRVFRRACLDRIKLYDGMHRFFPTLFGMEGFTICEMPVNHRPRPRGASKYGINNRLWRGLRDLMAVRWMQRRTLRYPLRRED